MDRVTIPLFPLHTVLFPGGPLPLRIFEQRYIEMVRDSIKNDSGIGICLIRDGSEVGEAATTYEIGTLSKISYWHRRADGLLGVTVTGEQRFRILSCEVADNQLTLAEVELIANEAAEPLPEAYQPLADRLRDIVEELGHPFITLEKRYDSADWVGARLTELSNLSLANKQQLLLTEPLERLKQLQSLL